MRNHRRAGLAALTAVFMFAALAGSADAHQRNERADPQTTEAGSTQLPASGAVASGQSLEMYEATVDGGTLQELVSQGYDVTHVEDTAQGSRVALVLSPGEHRILQAKGVEMKVSRTEQGLSASRLAAQQAQDGFEVYRSFDENGGIRDEMYRIARQNRNLVKLEVLGETIQGREYIALKVTQNARTVPDNSRPAVLYVSTHHAREWISTEVNRRLLHWYIDQFKAGNPTVTNLLQTTELWFVLVHNPDGYEYTFDVERLWRKNLRDNDGDGQITNADGVDPNRNYDEHWNYDDEGSATQISDQTFRGTAPESEAETQALVGLFDDVDFEFAISYHSFGPLLLYTQGWQVLTPSADDPIYMALTGDDNDPAIPGSNPGVGADLYTTNGEFTDWAHGDRGTLAWTPELNEGCEGCGFVFPDDEALIQDEFELTRDFAVNVARSAGDPDDPQSHWGMDTAGLYVNEAELDPWKSTWPQSDLRVQTSYAGDSSQPVEVLAKRDLGSVTLNFSINGGAAQTAPTSESPDGERFGGNNAYDVYYHYLRGQIPGLEVGDTVDYWFTGGTEATDPVTFNVVEDSDDAEVLILAAEDRTGASTFPAYPLTSPTHPNFLSYYEDALNDNGIPFDVYDVDAEGRVAPDHLGVMSHYEVVIWYRGNDIHVREPAWPGGNVSRLAVDETLEVRQYLNGGGKLLYTGQLAGATENGFGGVQLYDPVANQQCTGPGANPTVTARCLRWDDKNDFFQYYLGAYLWNAGAGTDAAGDPFPITGVSDPYTGMNWTLNGGNSAKNQGNEFNPSFINTSSLLDVNTYPQFASDAPAMWDRGLTGTPPFEPHSGTRYLYSDRADISYKRLTTTLDLTGVAPADAQLNFFTSYDTELLWDFLIVEAHHPGQDDWDTLPDANGHTTTDTGNSCPEGWHTDPADEIHPFLAHYQTWNAGPPASCTPTGTSGDWNGGTGRSDGWEEWRTDLSAYAGGQVEISISYVSDWGFQGLGVWLDDINAPGTAADTGFEDGTTGAWTVSGAAPGSDANPNDWRVTTSLGFKEGAVVSTEDTLLFGFGFEGITGREPREQIMDASLNSLGL